MKDIKNLVSLIVISCSLGWIIGMSATPIISTVIGPVLTIVISLLTILTGLELKKDDLKVSELKIKLFPVAVFCLFLALSGSVGIYSRTHNWLGLNNIANGSFSSKKTPNEKTDKTPYSINEYQQGVFKGVTADNCSVIYSYLSNRNRLESYLHQLNQKEIEFFLSAKPDSTTLVNFAKNLCKE